MSKPDNHASSMRLFVAVPLPSEIKQVISTWSSILQQQPQFQFRKWVYPEDLHITLQFLGDTRSDRIPYIIDGLRTAVTEITPFQICIESLGTFGRPNFPSVLWSAIGGEVNQLRFLQEQVVSKLSPLGFAPEERPYHPHLTLARKYNSEVPLSPSTLTLHQEPSSAEGKPLQWLSDSIVLYATHMHEQPMYEAVTVVRYT
ncbi:RNA 2',3'-cyclic phosphodiesterase [Paenibacillus sp. OV219]|uniref:RNA 2',3'-cyclic phosphodiesterase n=1 Tax=Paenibacillus sp. OV219 TaxID=1884377 RepID=UPI0008D78A01|nr:RNA 2',3'-cyclic phosphodiesterase [Paenibacillus sp. OV219]SEP14127.1 2'-5' RNA ligase [Paenibacillus sp. OV219]